VVIVDGFELSQRHHSTKTSYFLITGFRGSIRVFQSKYYYASIYKIFQCSENFITILEGIKH